MPPAPRRSAPRIIDASANRAREALRVMEDAARFILDDADLASGLKSLRHDLAAALAALPGGDLIGLAHRDTGGDVGAAISTPSEMRRESTRAVVIAAGKRLAEALRSIEEFTKIDAPLVAPRFESARYRAYDLEARLALAMGTGRGVQWRLCIIITESLCEHHPWLNVARLAIDGGADCLQLREKSVDSRDLIDRARALVDVARTHARPPGSPRPAIIINDRPDIALLAGADGVHLGQTDMQVRDARRIVGADLVIGISTTNLDEARAALRDGADSCGVGPMFPTTTKHRDVIAGPRYMREYASHDPPLPPHLAIGGITPQNIAEVARAGARGVAVSGAVCSARDPRTATESLLRGVTLEG